MNLIHSGQGESPDQNLIRSDAPLAGQSWRTFSAVCALVCLLIFCATESASAQSASFEVSEFRTLLGTLPDAVDDVVIGPNGEIILSRTQLQEVGIYAPGTANEWTPLGAQSLVALSLAMGPDGALYIGDSLTHNVLRYDFTTGLITTVSTGFFVPIDIVFDQAGTMLVIDLTTSDFFMGPNDVYAISVVNGVETQRSLLAAGIIGAADIEDGLDGKFYLGSLGSIDIFSFEAATQTIATEATNVFLPSDIAVIEPGLLWVTTLFQAELYELVTSNGLYTRLATGLGGGSGAEDIAFNAATGNAIVTINSGEVYEVDATSAFRQMTPAALGSTLSWRLKYPQQAGLTYSLALSSTLNQGIALPGNSPVALDQDDLFDFTAAVPRPSGFESFLGTLDADGLATVNLFIPNLPSLSGVSFFAAGVVFPAVTAPISSWVVTNATQVTIE